MTTLHAGARSAVATEELVRELSRVDTGPVLSAHLRTDPRDPTNTNHVPGWLVALRNGLRAIGEQIEVRGDREERLAFREAGPRIERDLRFLSAAARGRSLSYFAGRSGVLRISHQLPLRDDSVHWDARPHIGPLVELVERGRATGLVLVAADAARLLEWQGGRVEEPERSEYTLELGDWRDYAGPAAADPARGQHTVTHREAFEQRVEDWRRRWVKELAAAVADRARTLGWDRLLLAGPADRTEDLLGALPDDVAGRVIGRADVNVLGLEPSAIAERLEVELERAADDAAVAVLERVRAAWAAGQPAAVALDAVLGALVERRVEHLVLDPAYALRRQPPGEHARQLLDGAPDALLGERAIEAAIAGGARVTTLPAIVHPDLNAAGGMVALLRY
jgi:hypothetical protein